MINTSGISMLQAFPREFTKSIEFCSQLAIDGAVDKIVIAGMGGSSYPGSICKTYLEDFSFDIPIEIRRDYSLGKSITETTLVMVSSYSGNTEEALDCYIEALKKKCQTVVITSGGSLLELAIKHKSPLVRIIVDPASNHPNLSTGYFIGITLCILENSGWVSGVIKDVKLMESFLASLNTRQRAKAIAKNMARKIPIIYTSTKFEESIARIIKIRLNENAKIPAFYNVFPELTHYEPIGFIQKTDEFHFVLIEDPDDYSKVRAHMAAFEEIFIKRHNLSLTKIALEGENTLQKIVGVIYLFEWITLYLADIYRVDPFSLRITQDLRGFISFRNG